MFKLVIKKSLLPRHLLLLSTLLAGVAVSGSALAKRSPEDAFRYQQHMSQAGYPSAIYKLGVMYQNGYGSARNLTKALALYEESLKMGHKPAKGRIKEVKLLLESGEPATPVVAKVNTSRQKSAPQDAKLQAQLKAEREKLRREKSALEQSKRQTQQANLVAQSQRKEEQRKLQQELALFRAEKAAFEKEQRKLKAQQNLEKWRVESADMDYE